MKLYEQKAYSYFPGCSLATSAKENNKSLLSMTRKMGVDLIELPDWNCCGSSSTHSINHGLSIELAARNLSLIPANLPLVVACPSCYIRLCQGYFQIKGNKKLRDSYEETWNKPFNDDLKIIHLFRLLEKMELKKRLENSKIFKDISYVPYYGCMLSKPIDIPKEDNYNGTIETIMDAMGAESLQWSSRQSCCGTFLSVTKPKSITPVINRIISDAIDFKADCIVTACSMCHMNLEIRCDLDKKLPILHLTELISIALGSRSYKKWFSKHLVDPYPLLKEKGVFK
jgi:heterodisulfide reductase subunit B